LWLLERSRLNGLAVFFTLMYFFTESDAIPAGKWELVWRFIAGLFS
jgi:RsiW-degrading membrane proteinase PrsW (M82 family)